MASQLIQTTHSLDLERYECIDGVLIEKPVPTITHASLQLRALDPLRNAAQPLGMTTLSEVSLNQRDVERSDWMTPDVMVSKPGGFKGAANDHALPPVALAVEILSPGQSFLLMRQKAERYLTWGVRAVWLIDPDSKAALCFSSEIGAGSGHLIFDGTLRAGDLFIHLSQLFG